MILLNRDHEVLTPWNGINSRGQKTEAQERGEQSSTCSFYVEEFFFQCEDWRAVAEGMPRPRISNERRKHDLCTNILGHMDPGSHVAIELCYTSWDLYGHHAYVVGRCNCENRCLPTLQQLWIQERQWDICLFLSLSDSSEFIIPLRHNSHRCECY